MIREIMHDPLFLGRKSAPAAAEDIPIARDLYDTLLANRKVCVGMAANMIGESRSIIVFFNGPLVMTMFNPEIVERSQEYEAEEGCLSLGGTRKTKRWRRIKVAYQDYQMRLRTGTFEGFTAQIIQHEIDHCSGVLI